MAQKSGPDQMSPRGRPQPRVRSVPWPDDVVDEVLQLEAEYDQHSGPMTSDERPADRADVATQTGIVALAVGLVSAVVAVAVPWSSDDALRWVPVVLVPVAGVIGAVVCLRAIRPTAPLREGSAPDGAPRPAGREARVTGLLVANVVMAVALLPAAWGLLVLIAGP